MNDARPRNTRPIRASCGHPGHAIRVHNGYGCVLSRGGKMCPPEQRSAVVRNAAGRSAGARNAEAAAAYPPDGRGRPMHSIPLRSAPDQGSRRDDPACAGGHGAWRDSPPLRLAAVHGPYILCSSRGIHNRRTWSLNSRHRNMSRNDPQRRWVRIVHPGIPDGYPPGIPNSESGHRPGHSVRPAGDYSPGQRPDWQLRGQGERRASCSLTKG